MARSKNDVQRVSAELTGTPVAVDGRTVTPVVRVDGMLGRGSPDEGNFSFGFLRFKPVRAIVRDASGQEKIVATIDVNESIQRSMAISGALVAIVSIIVIIVRKLK